MVRLRFCSLVLIALLLAGSSANGASPAPVQLKKLTAPAPSWWTSELRTRVDAAGARGVSLPADARATIPASSLAFIGIRPGGLIIAGDALCSTNFVFYSGSTPPPIATVPVALSTTHTAASAKSAKTSRTASTSSAYFIGTAGHCGSVGTDVYMVFLPVGLARIGKIVKSVAPPEDRNGNFDVSKTDFALISIDPALYKYVSPSMAYWGGPTGIFTGSGVQPLLHAGWGLVVGTGGTPRAAVAYAWRLGSEYRFQGAITPGDSGSGAIVAGGLAAGNITHLAVDTRQVPPVWTGGTTMTAILQYLGSSYKLATCKLAVPWPLPGCPPA